MHRLHGHRWRRYWRNNFVIRLIPNNTDNIDLIDAINRRSAERTDMQMEYYEGIRNEEIEEFS